MRGPRHAVLWCVIFLLWAATLLLAVKAADRSSPSTGNQLAVLTPEARPGDIVQLEVRVTHMRACNVEVIRQFIGPSGTVFPLQTWSQSMGPGYVRMAMPFTMPDDAISGVGRYRSRAKYRCNWLAWIWPVSGPVRDVPITVLPK